MKNKLNLPELESKKVFAYFEELAAIPHGSRNTRQISDYLICKRTWFRVLSG